MHQLETYQLIQFHRWLSGKPMQHLSYSCWSIASHADSIELKRKEEKPAGKSSYYSSEK